MLNRILRLAAFQNPEFYKAQAMRLSTYDKPRIIACGQESPGPEFYWTVHWEHLMWKMF